MNLARKPHFRLPVAAALMGGNAAIPRTTASNLSRIGSINDEWNA